MPDGWRREQLGNVAEIILGQSPPSADVFETEVGFPFLQGNAEFGERHPSASSWVAAPPRTAPPMSTLVSVRAPVGELNHADVEYAIGRGLAAIAARNGLVVQDYLFWMLGNAQSYFDSRKQGSTFDAINKADLVELPLLLPPLHEQQKIAAILSSVDAAIAATRKVIEQTKRVKQGLLQTLMTRGIGHTRFKPVAERWITGRSPTIVEIPQEWELTQLTEVARLESGHTPSRGRDDYWGGDIPWVSLHDTDRLAERVIRTTTMTVTEAGLANSSARLLPEGTVVFSRTATVGRCSLLGRPMATSQDFANYVCGPMLDNRFLCHLFRSMGAVWKSLCAGSTHQTIYMPDFRELQIALPPIAEQMEIADRIDAIDDLLDSWPRYLRSMKLLKRGLMQDLLTGRVRVQPD